MAEDGEPTDRLVDSLDVGAFSQGEILRLRLADDEFLIIRPPRGQTLTEGLASVLRKAFARVLGVATDRIIVLPDRFDLTVAAWPAPKRA